MGDLRGVFLEFGLAPTAVGCFGFAVNRFTFFWIGCGVLGSIALWMAHRASLRAAAKRIFDSLAERLAERERITGELHDTLLQSVQGLVLLFYGISVQLPADNPLSEKIDFAIGRAERLLETGRESVGDLRSTDFSLEAAFRSLSREFEESSTEYQVLVSGEQPALQPLICDDVFKLGREGVRNALQHAEAKTVEVHIAFRPHGLEVRIEDDGTGISEDNLRNTKPGQRGILAMRALARRLRAQLEIKSEPGQGTSVVLLLPASAAYRNMIPRAGDLVRTYWGQIGSGVGRRGSDKLHLDE